ncbi:hypothetical protein [Aureimonas sp. AU4]|uniref:hypothetical protein n=1 Tax=Aureimonas sp. AU4 TaxID=1638163 RepID=UPI000785CBA3|nr:hypothetical protein [Aureimonas sp. AU4]
MLIDGMTFDLALAQSVFTHPPITHPRPCMTHLWPRMRKGGRFFWTFFMASESLDASVSLRPPPFGEEQTFSYCDPFHAWNKDILFATQGLAWHLEGVRDSDHPRGQQIAHFVAV